MSQDRLQATRFELKYRIAPDIALEARDFVRAYLVADEFSADKPDYSYNNHSVYLDSDDFRLYYDVLNGNKNRYKLRVRFYDDNPSSPVFFEIKRRVDNAILKKRCAVHRVAVGPLLAGQIPSPEHLLNPNAKSLDAIQEFCRLMEDIRATPKTHVCYRREAWMNPGDNSVRVSFDREVCSGPHFSNEMTTRIENYVMPFEPDVIMELKFTGRFPDWFRHLVQRFGAMQVGAAKYADGVEVLGEGRLSPNRIPYDGGKVLDNVLLQGRISGV